MWGQMLGEAAAWSLGDRSFTFVSWRLMLFYGVGGGEGGVGEEGDGD